MRKHYSHLLLCIGIIFFLAQSCKKTEDACTITTVASAQVQYAQLSIKDSTAVVNGFPFDSTIYYYNDTIIPYLNAINLEVDTIGIMGIPNSGYFSFFLNPNSHLTSYAIRYDTIGSYHDTIRIYHTSIPSYVSNECGFTHFFKIDSMRYSSAIIDSTSLINTDITLDKGRATRMADIYFFKEI